MRKAPIRLQDLRRGIYVKAKADTTWRVWGLYVHVCKPETLRAAYDLAKANDGAPGIDWVTFEAIFEADFCDGSYGYRPKRSAEQALTRVVTAIRQGKTRVLDLDLAAYFDTVRHDLL